MSAVMSVAGAMSYSKLKDYDNCAKKYHEVRVLKKYPRMETDEASYGTTFHEAAERYIRDGTPLPLHFQYVKSHLDVLKSIPGTKYCEYEMGLTTDLQPCAFNAPDVAWRGITDLLIVNEDLGMARIVDYKTGKSAKYADPKQNELMSLMVFKHFPAVRRIKAGLLFVVANSFIKSAYDIKDEKVYWRYWIEKLVRLERAHQTGVWNPTKNGLCRNYCEVVDCAHNGKFRG